MLFHHYSSIIGRMFLLEEIRLKKILLGIKSCNQAYLHLGMVHDYFIFFFQNKRWLMFSNIAIKNNFMKLLLKVFCELLGWKDFIANQWNPERSHFLHSNYTWNNVRLASHSFVSPCSFWGIYRVACIGTRLLLCNL